MQLLRNHNIIVDWATIRKPMGNYKPKHLRMLLELPEVKEQYLREFGHPYTEEEFDMLVGEFRPLMTKYIVDDDLSKPIEGALECIYKLKEAGISVGCDTGYYNDDSIMLNKKLEDKYGMHFDVATNSEIVPGRPLAVYGIRLYAQDRHTLDRVRCKNR